MSVLPAEILSTFVTGTYRDQEGEGSPGTGAIDGCELS